eukprot:CAMPEP_0197120260 /NCGR_PEP_ID=MMETSP1390-20130617/2826_1 /TAXON_ID=38833 /ORGANISM="Micromonas sp., Strain CCMP2099" /LENGTH=126 /DNA_ID=CAMNT_0042562077 /DNA_START=343 /DNA_END=720 /DNA_ORIENTATION=+
MVPKNEQGKIPSSELEFVSFRFSAKGKFSKLETSGRKEPRDPSPPNPTVFVNHDDEVSNEPPRTSSSVSSRSLSSSSRALPGHWRNLRVTRSHLRRITPFSSGAVLQECVTEVEIEHPSSPPSVGW